MRYYGFGNYYLSSIQQGIQAAHVIKGLWTEYEKDTESYQIAEDWARDHKTMVLLNGGNAAGLRYVYEAFKRFESQGMTLPFAKFNEDEQSLDGALTAVGIVLPEKYYLMMDKLRRKTTKVKKHGKKGKKKAKHKKDHFEKLLKKGWQTWELELMKIVMPARLAS